MGRTNAFSACPVWLGQRNADPRIFKNLTKGGLKVNGCERCVRNVKRLNFNRGIPHWRSNCVACPRINDTEKDVGTDREVNQLGGNTHKAVRRRSRKNNDQT